MRIGTALAVAGGGLAAAVLAPGMVVARKLHSGGFDPLTDRIPGPLDLEITSLGPCRVTLRRGVSGLPSRPDEPGHFLLRGARGWGHAGPVLDANGVLAVREFRHGMGGLRAGDRVRLDSFAFDGDPRTAHGLAFEDARFTSPLGEFPAWFVPGQRDTWAVMTHGKGADRRETLRLLPVLAQLGIPSLAITYRNDEGCPPAPGGLYTYGRDEWEELDGAVRYALDHGARNILIVGYSMGGAISLAFMGRSSLASRVTALILDAPMINLSRTVEHGARRSGIPSAVLPVSNRIAARRHRFDWRDFDHFGTACGLNVPVLLFHGDADPTVPVATSDALAAARPDLIRYVRLPGVAHVRAWNHDPGAYRAAVTGFLEGVLS